MPATIRSFLAPTSVDRPAQAASLEDVQRRRRIVRAVAQHDLRVRAEERRRDRRASLRDGMVARATATMRDAAERRRVDLRRVDAEGGRDDDVGAPLVQRLRRAGEPLGVELEPDGREARLDVAERSSRSGRAG